DLAEQARLRRGDDPVGHPDSHHEMARRGFAVENADPLQTLLVVVRDRPPSLAGEADEVFGDVEPVALGFQRFDLVHGVSVACRTFPAARRRRTAHAFNSGWRDSGSRPPRVRLLALL